MEAKLDGLAVDACVSILRFMHAARFAEVKGSEGAGSVGHLDNRAYIDVHHLASWYNRQTEELARRLMADDRSVRSCMTYEDFFKQICTVRRY
jgi:hypothetical protein